MSIICRFSFSRISSSLITQPLSDFFFSFSFFCSRSLSLSLYCCISCFVSLSCRPYLVLCVSLLSRLCVFRYSILLLPITTTRISFRFVFFCCCLNDYRYVWILLVPPPSRLLSTSCLRLWLVTLVHERRWSFLSGVGPIPCLIVFFFFFRFDSFRVVLFLFLSFFFFLFGYRYLLCLLFCM